MSDVQRCHRCTRPCPDGYVCHTCTDAARQDLAGIALLAGACEDKRARRRNNHPTEWTSPSRVKPLPYDPRVSDVLDPIITAMIGTLAVITEGRGITTSVDVFDLPSACEWVTKHLGWLRTTPEGPEEFTTFEVGHANLVGLFTVPPPQLYLGECAATENTHVPCSHILYVENKTPLPSYVRCEMCGVQTPVDPRRDYFRHAIAAYQATMRELVTLAPILLDGACSERTLHEWARRGLLPSVGTRLERNLRSEWRQVATYRIGDLTEAAAQWERTKGKGKGKTRRAS